MSSSVHQQVHSLYGDIRLDGLSLNLDAHLGDGEAWPRRSWTNQKTPNCDGLIWPDGCQEAQRFELGVCALQEEGTFLPYFLNIFFIRGPAT